MDSSVLFLPELLLIASIMAIPGLYIFTENRNSYSICSNLSLSGALAVTLRWMTFPNCSRLYSFSRL